MGQKSGKTSGFGPKTRKGKMIMPSVWVFLHLIRDGFEDKNGLTACKMAASIVGKGGRTKRCR